MSKTADSKPRTKKQAAAPIKDGKGAKGGKAAGSRDGATSGDGNRADAAPGGSPLHDDGTGGGVSVGEAAGEGEPRDRDGQRKKDKKRKKDKGKKDGAKKDGDNKDKRYNKKGKLRAERAEHELGKLQTELVKLQYWVKAKGLRVVALFEGRDAAGKGGCIKRISECMNPRGCRVVALGTATEREKTQWYFQRYAEHLPAAGEIVLFDRSWYNRAGVERVMGFCTKEQYREFLASCPMFERMLVRAGIILIKYWFSVSDDEQERRFRSRAETPTKRWKLSPMDLESRSRWVEYSKAKDVMFDHTDINEARWYVVNSDDKRRARLNCITHLLSCIPYEDLLPHDKIDFPDRQVNRDYERPPLHEQTFVPDVY